MSLKNRTIILPTIAILCAILLQSGMRADASGVPSPLPPIPLPQDEPPPILILPPPGESDGTTPMTVLLEVASNADTIAVSQAAASLGAAVLYPTHLAYTGVVVSAEQRLLSQLSAIPGVLQTHMMQPKQRLRTRISEIPMATDFISRPSGLTGRGVRIGIVDSGIDYTHLTFGGSGTVADFDSNNPTIIEPGSFPTAKVVGGYDLVGDSYDASGDFGQSTPVPDPDPLDCRLGSVAATLSRGGHGTHVASSAAGFGVKDGQIYPGPYDDSLQLDQFDIPPGIAPEATLYAYKIFGCRGSSTFLLRAIEQAIDPNGDGDTSDHEVDVLILALGAPYGSPDEPEALAIEKAVKAGVIVVAAAGDTGDVFYSVSTPGSANGAITVGASTGSSIADFSSRGAQRTDQNVKPDLVAPGMGVVGAAAGGGATSAAMDGTSASAALVGGAAALLREQHLDWSPAFIRSALMGTATPLVNASEVLYPVTLAGTGRVDPRSAANNTLLATFNNQSGGLSFGVPRAYKNKTITHNLILNNTGSTSRDVTLSSTVGVSETGIFMSFERDQVSIPAQESVTIPVTVTIEPAELESTLDPFTLPFQGIFDRFGMYEHSGLISVSEVGGKTIRVPFQVFPLSASQASAANLYNAPARGQSSFALKLSNTGARNQPVSSRGSQTPLVSAFELVAKSPALGDELFLAGGADLEYVGITSSYSVTQNVDTANLFFGTSSYKPWSTPNEVQMRVYLDTTGPEAKPDGVDDYVLVSTSFGAVTQRQPNDAFISILYRIEADGSLVWAQTFPTYLNGFGSPLSSPFIDTTPFNSRVMFQQLTASYIGLSNTQPTFRYHVETRSRDIGNYTQIVDRVPATGSLEYDVIKPAIAPINAQRGTPNLYQRPVFVDVNGGFVDMGITQDVLEQRQEQFILMLHHHNPIETQAEVLSIHKPDPPYQP